MLDKFITFGTEKLKEFSYTVVWQESLDELWFIRYTTNN